jgi:hypothetical protein
VTKKMGPPFTQVRSAVGVGCKETAPITSCSLQFVPLCPHPIYFPINSLLVSLLVLPHFHTYLLFVPPPSCPRPLLHPCHPWLSSHFFAHSAQAFFLVAFDSLVFDLGSSSLLTCPSLVSHPGSDLPCLCWCLSDVQTQLCP